VSSEEQVEGYSLSAQERAIAAYCAAHGYEVVACYRDEGKSARSDDVAKRAGFGQLMADAEARRFEVVIVHKLDRFARNRRVAFDAFHRLGSAGVGFVSIAENMDYSTPAGQLMLTMLVGLAQFYSDNLSWETRKGKGERKARGLHNGLLPFGTTKGAHGLPVLDTSAWACDMATRREIVPADGLRLAFELAAAGKSDREIARGLNDAGYRTTGNRGHNPFTKDTVRTMLINRFYVGDLPDGQGGWVPGKHAAFVDPALFERAQTARAANTSRPRWVESKRQPWALSGVAVCGGCGANVNALSHSTGRRRIRCAGRTQGNGCEEPSCYADVIEDQIGELLAGFAVPEEERGRLLAAWRYYQSRDTGTAAERIRLNRRLARLKDLYLDGEMDRAEYQAERKAVADALAALPTEGDPASDAGERLAAFLADVASAWKVSTPTERNKLARQLFASVVVSNRTAVAVVPRPDLRPFFFALPRPDGVNPDGKECTGGSDGDRFRVFYPSRGAPSHSVPEPTHRVRSPSTVAITA
jgi:DNA invertase Pin-like site-specific DNA recombinase